MAALQITIEFLVPHDGVRLSAAVLQTIGEVTFHKNHIGSRRETPPNLTRNSVPVPSCQQSSL
jgi:hypothetical protein